MMHHTPDGWLPQQGSPVVDPDLKTDLNDIKSDPEMTKEYMDAVVEKLKTVYDPEISVDIHSLGLIYDVRITESRHVFVLMSLTSAWCPVADILPVEVQQKIESIPGLKCKVKITMLPQWGRDMIDPQYRELLGL
jgi:metal-sulfur cluster biosynthetic enzyme